MSATSQHPRQVAPRPPGGRNRALQPLLDRARIESQKARILGRRPQQPALVGDHPAGRQHRQSLGRGRAGAARSQFQFCSVGGSRSMIPATRDSSASRATGPSDRAAATSGTGSTGTLSAIAAIRRAPSASVTASWLAPGSSAIRARSETGAPKATAAVPKPLKRPRSLRHAHPCDEGQDRQRTRTKAADTGLMRLDQHRSFQHPVIGQAHGHKDHVASARLHSLDDVAEQPQLRRTDTPVQAQPALGKDRLRRAVGGGHLHIAGQYPAVERAAGRAADEVVSRRPDQRRKRPDPRPFAHRIGQGRAMRGQPGDQHIIHVGAVVHHEDDRRLALDLGDLRVHAPAARNRASGSASGRRGWRSRNRPWPRNSGRSRGHSAAPAGRPRFRGCPRHGRGPRPPPSPRGS